MNKTNSDNEEFIRNTLANKNQIVGVIPASTEIASAGLKGKELVGEYENIKELAQTILIRLQ